MELTAGQKVSRTWKRELAAEKAAKTRMKKKLQALKELFDKKEVDLKRKLAAEKAAKTRMKKKLQEKEVDLNRLREEIEYKNKQLASVHPPCGEK